LFACEKGTIGAENSKAVKKDKGSSWLNYVQIIGLVCKTSSSPQFFLASAVHSNVLGYVHI